MRQAIVGFALFFGAGVITFVMMHTGLCAATGQCMLFAVH